MSASIPIPVSGMTCAACSARVQRALEKQPGVEQANVNLMMKTATVRFDPAAVTPDGLVEAIKATGYGAQLASPDQTAFEEQEARDRDQEKEFQTLKRKAIVSGVLGAIVMIASMLSMNPVVIPSAARDLHSGFLYAQMVVTLVVMVWAGRHFYTRAWSA